MRYKLNKNKPDPLAGPVCKKKAYHTKEEAEDMIHYITETRVTRIIKAYQCKVCGLWHLTSKQNHD